MSVVFVCPQCGTPLGTWANPRPDPLPPCLNCGWGLNRDSAAAQPSQFLRLGAGLLALALGAGGGAVCALMLFFIPAWIALGPCAAVGVTRMFPRLSLVLPAGYALGFTLGVGVVASRSGPMAQEANPGAAYLLGGAVGVASMLIAWFVSWWRSE